jgi:HK97 family phage portal protein
VGLRQRISDLFRASDADRSVAIAGPGEAGAQVEQRSSSDTSTLGKPAEWLSIALGGRPSTSGIAVGPDNARGNAAVYAAVDLRSSQLAQLPLKLYRRSGTQREEVTDRAAARVIRRPCGAQTSFLWRAWGSACVDMRGNYFGRVLRDQFFEPRAIIPIPPAEHPQPYITDSGDVVFRYRGENLTRAEILHIPALDTSDGLCGVSPISRLRDTVGMALATQQQAARFMANDATPPIALKSPGKLDETQMNNLRSQWVARQGGHNRGKPAVLQGGLEIQQIGFNARDTQLLESREFDVQEIARIFRVPKELINGSGASSWGSGIDSLIEGFVKFTIAPLCVHWEEMLNLTLLTEREQEEGYYFAFNLDALLRGNLKARAEALKIMRENGIISANEWRRLEELNDLPDTIGDVYLQPLNYVPAGSPAASGQLKAATPATSNPPPVDEN